MTLLLFLIKMAGDCPVGVFDSLVHCDVANFDVCQNRGVAKKGSNPHPLPERMRSAGTNPLPRFPRNGLASSDCRQCPRILSSAHADAGLHACIDTVGQPHQGGTAWAVQGQLVTSVKQGVAQLCETPLDEAAFEKSKTA
jgi:hypothetical protein